MGIAHWFRDWNTYTGGPYGKGSNRAPGYNPPTRAYQQGFTNWGGEEGVANVSFTGDITVPHDTSFKNFIIKDSLPFSLMNDGSGRYQFEDGDFFKINGRGFGNEWVSAPPNNTSNTNHGRNYAFSMEMVYPFVAKDVNNMVFNFRGDDDVWVFIDRDLVLDLGGIKEATNGSFTLAGRGLREGGKYTLRVFYVERHSTGSSILIQTNIVAPPADIKLSTSGNANDAGSYINDGNIPGLTVEDKKTVYAHIFDDQGQLLVVPCERITWTLSHADGKIETIKGKCEIEVTTTVSGNLKIEATYIDPENPSDPVTGQTGASFKPLPADSLWVMKDGFFLEGGVIDRQDRVFEAYFAAGQQEATLWIIEVDKYGNYVQHYGSDPNFPRQIDWVIEDARVVDVRRGNSSGSMVILTRKPEGEGVETLITFKGKVYPDPNAPPVDREAKISTGTVGEPAMAIGPNPFVPGQTNLKSSLGDKVYGFYEKAIDDSKTGGKGILITVDAPAKLRPQGKKGGFGRVMIYDAVGNVVHSGTLYESGTYARSYAYAWDGANNKGRRVGPGTYLVVISGVEEETGIAFNPPRRKIGVTAVKK
jgi:fibro-slime domain-containing protein